METVAIYKTHYAEFDQNNRCQDTLEPELKEAASKLLDECSLSMSDGIRLFLKQVVTQRGLPFDMKAPNAATIAAPSASRPFDSTYKAEK